MSMSKNLEFKLKRIESKDKGALSVIEANVNCDFDIKRVYYTYDVLIGAKRGMHAHRKLDQIIWCPYGRIRVVMDDGAVISTHILETPEQILKIPRGYWHEMYWELDGSVLCAAASDYYKEDDYIRDYSEFKYLVQNGYWCKSEKCFNIRVEEET